MRKLRRILGAVLVFVLVTALAPLTALASTPSQMPERVPVIFIPGIGGTELYNRNEMVWINLWHLAGSQIPIFNLFQLNWLMPLRLATDGVTPYTPGTKIHVGDIMRNGLADAYSGIVTALGKQGYTNGKDLRLFPYDWRADLNNSAEMLGALIDQTLKETGARKVVLIGHSQGGLVARDYVVRSGGAKVKATISLGTPWLGAPLAYKALEYGWDFGLQLPGTKWSALAPRDVKVLVQNFPSAYALVPNRLYFDRYPGGYLTRDGRALGYGDSEVKGVGAHNRMLAEREAPFLDSLLDGSDHGVQQYLIAGRSRATVSAFTEWKDWLGVRHHTEQTADGDEVVPLYSADLGYSVNPEKARNAIGGVAGVAYVNDHHTFLSQSLAVQQQVTAWLSALNGK